MPRLPTRRAPLWFHALVAIVGAVLVRHVAGVTSSGAGATGDGVHLAFFQFLIFIAEMIWKGMEVAGRVTLQILGWSVQALWHFAKLIADGATKLAQYTWSGLRKGWELLKLTYTNVLKPAWLKVYNFIGHVKTWLDKYVRPALNLLKWVKDRILEIYNKFVRPILDIIDVTRRALRILASLGVDWARRLDTKLGELEAKINAPFLFLLRELNKVINIVNRIVTADGLFQRLAFLQTMKRDAQLAWNTLWNNLQHPLTDAKKEETKAKVAGKPLEKVFGDVRTYMQTKDGDDAGLFDEMTAQWRKQLKIK